MKQYNYYIWYNECDRNGVAKYPKEMPLTIHDLKGNMIASEVMDEVKKRLEEIGQCEEYNLFIEIKNISLLNQHETK